MNNVQVLHQPTEYDAGHAAALVKVKTFIDAFDAWRRNVPPDENKASARELIEDGKRLKEVIRARIALRTSRV